MSRCELILTCTFALTFCLNLSAQPSQPKGGSPPPGTFKGILARIITAADRDHLESLLGKHAPDDLEYFPKVILPGFEQCRIRDEDYGRESDGIIRPSGAALVYQCTLVHGQNLTSSVKLAYENLVERVRQATNLPSETFEKGFKAESRPGSGVFLRGRTTSFPFRNETWLEVSLVGSIGGWDIDLYVHAPLGLMSYVREREAADAEEGRLAAEQAGEMAAQRAKGYWVDRSNNRVDRSNNLIWTVKDAGADLSWDAAVSYCRDLLLNGSQGWRLPEIEEMEGIHELGWVLSNHLKGKIELSGWTDTMSPRLRLGMGIWTATKQPSGTSWVYNVSSGVRDNGAHDVARVLCVHSVKE